LKWKPFTYQNETYSLGHVHPFEFDFIREAVEGKPERKYTICVSFSMHCFTRGKGDEETEQQLIYEDKREQRIFCFERYELSKGLREIIGNLSNCFHTRHGHYFTIEMVDLDGIIREYEIFFDLTKAKQKSHLDLRVRSAYIPHKRKPTKKKHKVKFKTLVVNTALGKSIKAPPT